MIHKGNRVQRRTKKVAQFAETGKVIAIHDEYSIEVEWDDGHKSIVSKSGVTTITDANRPHNNV
jgi:hypothetical protein